MPRTVTAMFDTRAAAEATRNKLVQAGVAESEIDLQDEGAYSTEGGSTHKAGLMAGIRNMFGAHEDHHTYAEGMSRGHVLLSATVHDAHTDKAIQILEDSEAIDLDGRESEWRNSGWTGQAEAYAAPAAAAPVGQTATAPMKAATGGDTLEVAEERLVVGKREVERGGMRVRSYMVETPVSQQVSLREETVGIERRPVNRAVGAGDEAFRDRSIEMRETGEEAVVGKEAFVTEEISLRKNTAQRTQEVNDTVRHTEVEVERVDGGTTAPLAGQPAVKRV